MSQRFNLTAQLQLQAPTNVGQVVGQIRRQLSGIAVDVQVRGNTRQLAVINREMQGLNRNASSAGQSVGLLNRNLAEAARRFSVITVATGTMLAFARSIKDGVGEAIQFERELVKISQVTGKSVNQLQGLTKEVTRLATSLGASSADLLNVSRTLAQAGFSAEKTKQALDILAKTSLAATFDSIQDTTEGAIAVLRQFGNEARKTGGDIKFLENTMDAINSVSKNFAVESGDLITVIRRVGGVFEAAGGNVNELIALFTSVRATTRESAETISTGLRTIFTRIQRTDTVDQLKQLGIQLRDSQGQFVGAYEAVRRLSAGLSSLDPKDYRFSEIVESLGGFRQIGKVIPLIRQFTTAQDALNIAQSASGSVARDAAIAQQSLFQQAQKVGQEFKALMRTFADSGTFRSIATGALELARAFIRIADALEPLLPMLGLLAGLRVGRGVAPLLGGLLSGGARGGGGTRGISRFASGGHVPGSGNRDTVPAMLTPGEFVIKKSSAKKLGPATLTAMNNNRYNRGSVVRKELEGMRKTPAYAGRVGSSLKSDYGTLKRLEDSSGMMAAGENRIYQAAFLRPEGRGKRFKGKLYAGQLKAKLRENSLIAKALSSKGTKQQADSIIQKYAAKTSYEMRAGSLTKTASNTLEDGILAGVTRTVRRGSERLTKDLQVDGTNVASALKGANIDQVIGNIFEAILSFAAGRWSNAEPDAPNAPFDFPKGLRSDVANKFGLSAKYATEAKSFYSEPNVQTLQKKAANQTVLEAKDDLRLILQRLFTQGEGAAQGTLGASQIQQAFGGKTIADSTANAREAGFKISNPYRGKYGITPIQRRASGGQIDNVPALLTPGEFVINKKSAQSIGYSNLNSMNRSGVSKFQYGGAVGGVQKFQSGGRARLNFRGVGESGNPMFTAMGRVTQALQQMGVSSQRTTRFMDIFQRAVQRGATYQQALGIAARAEGISLTRATRTTNQTAASTQSLNTATQQRTRQLRTPLPIINPSFVPAGGGGGGGRGGIRGFAGMVGQQIDPIAGAAQSFVFAGAMAGSLAAQFSGLSEVTKQTITEFSGWVATVVGLGGTLAQIFTSMASAGTAEAVASRAAAAGDITEAEASQVAAASGAAKGLMGIAAAALIVGGTFKYFSIQAKAEADELSKAADSLLSKIEEGGTGAGIIDKTEGALRRSAESRAMGSAILPGSVAAGAGVVGGMAIGASIGAMFAPVTLGLSVLAGVVIGAVVGFIAYDSALGENTNALNAQIKGILESVESLISLKTAAYNFNQELKDIDLAKLDPETRIKRRLDAQSTLAPSASDEALKIKELTIGAKKAVATESDFIEGTPERAAFEQATAALAAETDNLAKRVAESYKTLDEAFNLDIVQSGDFSFGELMDQNGQYAQSLTAVRTAIDLQTSAIVTNLQMQILAAKAIQNSTTASAEERKMADSIVDSSTKALADAQKRGTQRQTDLTKSQEDAIGAIQERKAADFAAAQAADQLRRSLDRLNNFGIALASEEAKLERFGISLDNVSAIMDDKAMDFTSSVSGLKNLSEVGDVGAFTNQLDNVIEALPDQMKPLGREAIKVVTGAARLMNEGRSKVLNEFGAGGPRAKTQFNLQDLADTAGVDLTTLTDAQRTDMGKAFGDAFQDEVITTEEFNKIFDPIINSDVVQQATDLLKRGNELRNDELKLRAKQLEQEREISNRRITAQQNIIKTEVQTAEMLAEARGQELSLAEKEAARTRAAQAGLSGTRLRAGDIGGAVNLIKSNNARQEEIKALIDNRDALNLSKEKIDDLQKEQEGLSDKTKKARTELGRLADQSQRVADIQAKIAEQQDIRESVSNIFEDFAFGGLKERRDILAGIGGIRAAMATGTVQNQSQAQRALTRQMLDALADVPIGPRGETGEQIKKFLAANDMMRMGLISKQQRDAVLTATTTEEKLIIALNMLTMEMRAARQGQLDIQAKGGYMSGPSHARGGIPVEVEGGEYVIRKSVVRQRGKGFFDRLNSGTLPKFPHGGPIDEETFLAGDSFARKLKERGDKDAFQKQYQIWVRVHEKAGQKEEKEQKDALAAIGRQKQAEQVSGFLGGALKDASGRRIRGRDKKAEADRQQRLKDEMAQDRFDYMNAPGRAELDRGAALTKQINERTRAEKRDKEFTAKDAKAKAAGDAEKKRNAKFGMVSRGPSFSETPNARRESEYNPKTGRYETTTPQPAYDPKTGGIKINTGGGQIPLSTPSLARSGFELSEQEKSKRKRAEEINKIRTEGKAKRDKQRQDRIAAGGPKGLSRNTTGVGSNLSKDFNREDHETSRQAARDRIAADEKARKDAAATRAANRAAESPEDKAKRQKDNRWIRQSERQAALAAGTAKGPGVKAKERVEARGGMTGGTPASRAAERVQERRGDITGGTPAERAKQRQEQRRQAPAATEDIAVGSVVGAAGGGGIMTPMGPRGMQALRQQALGGQPLQPGQRPPGGGKKAVRGPKQRTVRIPGTNKRVPLPAGMPRNSRWARRYATGQGGAPTQSRAGAHHGYRQGMGMGPWQGYQPQQQQQQYQYEGERTKSQTRQLGDYGGTPKPSDTYGSLQGMDFAQMTPEQQAIMVRGDGGGGGAGAAKWSEKYPPNVDPRNIDKPSPLSGAPTYDPKYGKPRGAVQPPPKPDRSSDDRATTTTPAPHPLSGLPSLPQSLPHGPNTAAPGYVPPRRFGGPQGATGIPGAQGGAGYTTTTTQTSATTGPTGAAPGGEMMDKLSGIVTQLETNFQSIVEKFSTLEHTHTFNGEIGIQVNIGNKDEIVNAVRNMIEPLVKKEVTDLDSTGNGGGGNGG